MRKFQRNYRAEFEIGLRNEQNQLVPQETLTIAYPFTCSLDIESGIYSSQQRGVFQFLNLSGTDQARLWLDVYNNGKKYIYMNFYAGYGNNMPLVFSGFVQSCTSQKEGGAVDYTTDMIVWDGGNLFKYGYLNSTFTQGTTLKDILDVATAGLKNVSVGYITPDLPPLPRNKTFIGQTMDLLGRSYGGYNIFVNNGELNILGDNDVIPGQVQVINDSTGLLGSPRRANGYVEVDMIFEPQLKAGQAIELFNHSLKWLNTVYKNVLVKHKGIISPAVSGKLITTATLTIFPGKPRILEKTKNEVTSATTGQWQKPVQGKVTDPFGWRIHPIEKKRKFHAGMDIGAPLNTPVYASANGRVKAYWNGNATKGFGKFIEIDNGIINGKHVVSWYGHLNEWLVQSGQIVHKGQQIAKVGSTGSSTGPHLHFQVNEDRFPVDPTKYIGNY